MLDGATLAALLITDFSMSLWSGGLLDTGGLLLIGYFGGSGIGLGVGF